jgi:outer membrane receptor for ferrienterochelin and colicins
MNIIKYPLLFLLILAGMTAFSQKIQGYVYELEGDQKKLPLPGANVVWAGTTLGTATDPNGYFELKRPKDSNPGLVVSFIGFRSDTISIQHDQQTVEIVLNENETLEEVEISERAPGAHISRTDLIATQQITLGELKKAACCNLSESFETNASVDVNYSDAITGAKQIKLLGLAGKYSQLQTENIPNLQGLATSYGLSYVPGSWMESIQVSKGTSSVKNGYESITGQINVEYKKPDNKEKLYLNFFGNQAGRIEGNINSSIRVSPKWNTAVFGHVSNQSTRIDHNNDSFLDDPMFTQVNLFNRWTYRSDKMDGMWGVKFMTEDRKGGQVDYYHSNEPGAKDHYGSEIKTNRLEVSSKTGFFLNRPQTSIGWINSFIYHDMNSFFGLNAYQGTQYHYYTNLMYQSFIKTTNHTITTGLSYKMDSYNEMLNDSAFTSVEHVPGAFFEYTWIIPEKFTLLAGIRGDYDNLYGFFVTPRLHLKYNITKKTVVRASAGMGSRTANVVAENLSLLASARQFHVMENLRMERAWTYGLNLTQYIDIFGKELSVNAEVYRTDFTNQVIVDKEEDISQIMVYNLDGKSYANTYQLELKYELIPRMDLTAAFRYNDVKMTIDKVLMREPLVNKYKGLVSVSYATNLKKWQFDVTAQFNGSARIPSTVLLPENYQMPAWSPNYTILNAQVTKFFKRWEIYLGGENLTNYKQHNPIIAADDPFGPYFDASNIWGPISGIKIYAGVRLLLKYDRL